MHGCIAIFDGAKPLKMKQAANRALRRSVLEKAMDGLFQHPVQPQPLLDLAGIDSARSTSKRSTGMPLYSDELARGPPMHDQRHGIRGLALLVLCAGLCASPAPVFADIYKYVDQHGVVHLSDRSGGAGWVLIMRGGKKLKSAAPSSSYRQNRRRYARLIDQIANKYRLDRALVHAIVKAESAYNASAISKKGAVGLMQLMPGTARRYGVRDRYNPAQNVQGGVRYLRDLLFRFNDVILALAAYNAGEGAVQSHGNKVPPYQETRTYIRRVLTYYKEFRATS